MRYNIADIRKEFEALGWTLLSASYKNLSTPLQCECPNHHQVEVTYDDWRKHHECPKCRFQRVQDERQEGFVTLALDQASYISGWSIFINKKLLNSGTFSIPDTLPVQERFLRFFNWLSEMLENIKPNKLVFEDIQLQDNERGYKTFKVLAQLQGVVQLCAILHHCDYEIVQPSVWRNSCGIKGRVRNEQKKNAQYNVKKWFGIDVSEDEADAICIGAYSACPPSNDFF